MKIGIIGAGQLGRMLALAGYPLGMQFVFLDPSENASAAGLGRTFQGAFDAAEDLVAFAAEVDVLTFDVENVPVTALKRIARTKPFWPPVAALGASQDRLHEKQLFRSMGIATAEFAAIDSLEDLQDAARRIGVPGVLKTRRLGYDGRGQYHLRQAADIAAAWQALRGVPLIYEEFVSFGREVSIIGVRGAAGDMRFYPLTRNVHSQGILRHSIAPYRNAVLQREAEKYLRRLLRHFDYRGVLTLELFVRRGRLIANEMAPRVHNSGHWTIEGAATSQFENHIRAVAGLPLGSTAATGHCAMINFIGTLPPAAQLLGIPQVHYHSYGKEPRAGRKLGHCTVKAGSARERDRVLKRLLTLNF